MSLVTAFTSLARGREIRAGHSITPGTRTPPSYTAPLCARKGTVATASCGVPLSPQYHSSVLARSSAPPSWVRNWPIARSIAVISANRSRKTSRWRRCTDRPVSFEVSRTCRLPKSAGSVS